MRIRSSHRFLRSYPYSATMNGNVKNISAQKTKARAYPWISQAEPDGVWPPSYQKTAEKRKGAARGIRIFRAYAG